MGIKWHKTYACFILFCTLSLFACVHNSCGYTAKGVFGAIFTLPAAPFIAINEKSDDMRDVRRVNEYANRNNDKIIDRSEARTMLAELGYSDKKASEILPEAQMYAFTENTKRNQRSKEPAVVRKRKKALILLSREDFIHVLILKKKSDTKRLLKLADTNADGTTDGGEARQILLALGFTKDKIDKGFEKTQQKFFTIRLYEYSKTFQITSKMEKGKISKAGTINIPWLGAESFLRKMEKADK